MFDIETLRLIWWGLLGFLIIGFAITDGWDFGAAIIYPLVARNEIERRIVLNVIGPFWEGNQVWIILGAGAIFAAWPYVYAVAFSGFYFLILLLLLTMGISRPVSFKYRSKIRYAFWRRTWDWIVFIGGVAPAIIFGILIGNVLSGAPFYFDNTLRAFYSGNFWELFSPFAIWCGVTSFMMLVMHGGFYLAFKTEDPVRGRAIYWARIAAFILLFLFAGGGLWTKFDLVGYAIVGGVDPAGYSNPLYKQVVPLVGAWMRNFELYPYALIAPAAGFVGAILAFFTARVREGRLAFFCSSVSVAGIIATVGVGMFPFILPSSTHYASSLLVWDASSNKLTLLVMLGAVAIFMPLILLYTAWVYYALRGKVTANMIPNGKGKK